MIFFYLFTIFISIILIFILSKNIFLVKEKFIGEKNPLLIELRSQLNNLIIEFEKNEIDESEYKSTKYEIEKRILKELNYSEEKKLNKSTSSIFFNKIFFFTSFLLILLVTSILYLQIGNYKLKDKPFSEINLNTNNLNQTRLNQINAENLIQDKDSTLPENNQLKELVIQLKTILRNRPYDLKGYNLLLENSARLGDFKTAYYAMQHMIQNINPTVSASDYSKLSELMIAATDGYISIEAENNLVKSLHLDGSNKRARYYYGLLKLQKNKLEEGYKIWKNLLKEETEESPWSQLIKQDISRLENLIKSQNNKEFSEDEKDMIYTMVSNLKKRIESEGGTFEDWFKLIRSYLVLGENELALEKFTNAKNIFKNSPDLILRLENLIKKFIK